MNMGRIESAKIGSKLERELVKLLSNEGVQVNFHTSVFGSEVDLFLPEYALAIEIDGPSHYNPIWGEEALKKTQLADKQKNAQLTSNNIAILRVKNFKTSFAYIDAVNLTKYVIEMLKKDREVKIYKIDLGDL